MDQINQQRKVFFIRHAQSTRNYLKSQIKDEESESKYLKGKQDTNFFDDPLTQQGVKQSEMTAQIMKHHNVQIVLVSPLRRALQTCDIIFKNHPSKPRIIVQPLLTEKIHSTSNIGTNIQQSMKMFPYFDFSNIKNSLKYWQIKLLNEIKKQSLLNILQKQNLRTSQEVGKLILNNIQNIKQLENLQDAKNRAFKLYNLLQQYENTYKDKVVFVGHGRITKIMCGIEKSKTKLYFPNSAVFSYNLDQNKMTAFQQNKQIQITI